MSSDVEVLGMHFIVLYDDESSMDAPKSVTYGKGLRAVVAFF